MRMRTVLTTGICICAGLGIMTSPVWFSSWMHETDAASGRDVATQAASSCMNGYYALTFDDGPFPGHTDKLIAMLKKLHVRATFFNVGKRAKKHPELVALQRTVGEVENHSWNHKNYVHFKTKAAIVHNIRKTQRVLGNSTYIRPPYGGTNAKVRAAIRKAGLTEAMWTVDTDDWRPPYTHRKVINHALMVKNGGIILMHDGWPYDIYALPELVAKLTALHMCSGKLQTTEQISSRMPGKDKDIYHSYPFKVRAGKP